MAVKALKRHGHPVIAIGLREGEIESIPIIRTPPQDIDIDTVTLYVGAERQSVFYEYLTGLKPRRVIFNPGAENDELAGQLSRQNVEVLEACTLVMLSTGQF
jgi:uncharacterized protein